MSKRVAPEYRPWVAQQLADPRFLRKRMPASLVMPIGFVIVPQLLLALMTHSRLRLLGAVLLVVLLLVAALVSRNRTLSEAGRRRLLAYHGVTADGTPVEPVSAWANSPLGKVGLGLLCAQLVVFTSGVAIAADRISAQRACHVLPAAHKAALAAVVGQSVPPPAAAAFGALTPIVAPGTPLIAAREVDGGFDGLYFVAAYVRDESGQLVGPGVWRILDPFSLMNPGLSPGVDAQNFLARQITPNTGYGGSSPAYPALATARDCAKAAR